MYKDQLPRNKSREANLWINNFSPKHLWSIPYVNKPQLWTHPCVHCWFRVPSHGDKDNSLFPLSLVPIVTASASFARLELIQNPLPYVCPRKNENTLTFVMFPQYFCQFSDVFKCFKCHCLVLSGRKHFTTGVLLLRSLSLRSHNFLWLITDLWKTPLVNYWQHNYPSVSSKFQTEHRSNRRINCLQIK